MLVGPAKGIHALVAARLIELGAASEAARVGKEFEDRVFESIRADGGSGGIRDVRIQAVAGVRTGGDGQGRGREGRPGAQVVDLVGGMKRIRTAFAAPFVITAAIRRGA